MATGQKEGQRTSVERLLTHGRTDRRPLTISDESESHGLCRLCLLHFCSAAHSALELLPSRINVQLQGLQICRRSHSSTSRYEWSWSDPVCPEFAREQVETWVLPCWNADQPYHSYETVVSVLYTLPEDGRGPSLGGNTAKQCVRAESMMKDHSRRAKNDELGFLQLPATLAWRHRRLWIRHSKSHEVCTRSSVHVNRNVQSTMLIASVARRH